MITDAYSTFFKGLEENNHKDWFHANKSRYEKDVKAPFLSLLEDAISGILEFDAQISTDAKAAIFRINRDIRFSKDKTPYNTLMKAGIAPGGKKSKLPGYYLGISADRIHVGGGLFGVDKDQLKQIRSAFAADHEAFTRIINDPSFKDYFGELKGERAKRLEPDFKVLMEKMPYMANKQFYAMCEIPLKDYIDSEKLLPLLIANFKCISPLNHYLKGVLV